MRPTDKLFMPVCFYDLRLNSRGIETAVITVELQKRIEPINNTAETICVLIVFQINIQIIHFLISVDRKTNLSIKSQPEFKVKIGTIAGKKV